MKEFFKKVVTILYIIFVLILVAFTCGSTEKGNFDVLPACFLILFSCLGITYLIARHNTKKINKEHDKKERKKRNQQFINNMKIVNKACEKQRKQRNQNYIENYKKETSVTFKDSKHPNKFDDSFEEFKIRFLCGIALLKYKENTSHN